MVCCCCCWDFVVLGWDFFGSLFLFLWVPFFLYCALSFHAEHLPRMYGPLCLSFSFKSGSLKSQLHGLGRSGKNLPGMAFISYRVIGPEPTCFNGESPKVKICWIVLWSVWSSLLFGGGGGAASILGAELRSCPSGSFRASVFSTGPLCFLLFLMSPRLEPI